MGEKLGTPGSPSLQYQGQSMVRMPYLRPISTLFTGSLYFPLSSD